MTNRYTYETHGDGYALYDGRVVDGPLEGHRHGYNLANMREIDTARLDILLLAANANERLADMGDELRGLLTVYDGAVDDHALNEAGDVDDLMPVLDAGSYLAGAVRRLLNA